jgi:hypothetical protein
VDFHTFGSRHNVNEEMMSTLQPGTTTKEYVLLTLGEPDEVYANGSCLTYTWEKVKFLWLLAGGSNADAGAIDRKYDLILCFDDGGLLVRKVLRKYFTGKSLGR